MAHTPEKRDALRRRYVYDRMDLAQAAETEGVGYATARRWKAAAEDAGDDWERARSVVRLTSEGQANLGQIMLEDYMTLHAATVQGLMAAQDVDPLDKAEAMSRLADAMNKTMSAVAKAAPQLNKQAIAADVLHRLVKFAKAHHRDSLPILAALLEPFGDYLAKELR
ncbi:MAG: hypothetical protein RLY86_685 [Pseudomonadota bacterium]|jgi:hypothetical protein